MTTPQLTATLEEIQAAIRWQREHKIRFYYPETGPLRRELYPRHIEFFAAGRKYGERGAIAANRVGKSESIGAYEVTLHATGDYPDWWPGYRFDRPTDMWVSGKTAETTRDIVQAKLLGTVTRDQDAKNSKAVEGLGTGMIPADCIINTSPKSGVPDAVDTVWVRHKSGGKSKIGFKAYGQGRGTFEGTHKDLIWFDEEPPKDVYDEALMRLMSTEPGQPNGLMLATFTPLEGYSEVVAGFLESSDPDKWNIKIGWADAPHLTPEIVEKMSRKYLPSQLKARSLGEPAMGEGAIYPIELDLIVVDDFPIPQAWPKVYGLDVGKTAGVWGAHDRDADILYLWREYFSEEYNPILHAAAIKAAGDWIPGVIDPASLGSSQVDGRKLFEEYLKLGLKLSLADNAVESGLQEVWMRLSTGRLKVFRSLRRWQMEYGRYHRKKRETEFGVSDKVVKKDDHLMDACVAPNTPVITPDGPVPIASLVGKSGRVLSRGGAWLDFIGARKTIENAPVVTVRFDDDSNVTCTPDHPFLTPDGWVKAADMANKSCYNGVSLCIHRAEIFGAIRSWFLLPVRCIKDIATTFAVSTINSARVAFGSTYGYGRCGTGGAFLLALSSTTKTTSRATIGTTILSSRVEAGTPGSTKQGTTGASLQRPSRRQGDGTQAAPDINGTSSTTGARGKHSTPSRSSRANNASGYLLRRITGGIVSALMRAGARFARLRASIMSGERAQSAGRTSASTATAAPRRAQQLATQDSSSPIDARTTHSTANNAGLSSSDRGRRGSIAPQPARERPARRAWIAISNAARFACAQEFAWTSPSGSATIRCISVNHAGTSDVYCLTVPVTHSFCVASGAVVHNTRYLVMSGLGRAKTKPVAKPNTPSAPFSGGDRGWMV